MRLVFAPHPNLLPNEPPRRTDMEVDPDEKMLQVLTRASLWLSLWVPQSRAKNHEWQVQLLNGINVDTARTPRELGFSDGETVYVTLREIVPDDPLDSVGADDAGIIPNVLDGENVTPPMPTEEDIINYEQAKHAALARARAIEQASGIRVSHRRILHDEAVDDYDDEGEAGDYEDGGYYGDMGFGHGEGVSFLNDGVYVYDPPPVNDKRISSAPEERWGVEEQTVSNNAGVRQRTDSDVRRTRATNLSVPLSTSSAPDKPNPISPFG